MKKNIVILGPTASGKTALSIEIANKFNLPIINVDTRQFWKNMRILTASPSDEELQSAKHILFNTENGNFFPSLGWWKDQIKEMQFNTKIIVGGNAFYINNLRKGIAEYENHDDNTEYTWNDLYNLDNNTQVHKNDIYRIQRQVRFLKYNKTNYADYHAKYHENTLIIAIIPNKEIIHERIMKRATMYLPMYIEEVKNGIPHINYDSIIGYKEIKKYLNNEILYEDLLNEIILKTYQYAKKQLKFLKSIHIDHKISTHNFTDELYSIINQYITDN